MPREFAIQKRLEKNATNGILDLPHLSILRYADPEKLLSDFKSSWGDMPQAVALPTVQSDGLLFPVPGLSDPISQYGTNISNSVRDFQDVVSSFAQAGVDIYLTLTPSLNFIRTSSLHVVDIVGDQSASICIYNQHARDVVAAILGTGIDIVLATTANTPGKLKGIVIDVANLWPMGASNKRLELTCFCPSCVSFFDEKYPGLLRAYRNFPNPWNLLLSDSGTGISFIGDIRSGSTDEDIVGLSRQKGFDEVFEDRSTPYLREQAKQLLRYMRARHEQTLMAIDDIFGQACAGLDEVLRRVILTEGVYYGWTSGLFLEDLDKSSQSCDEVWFDPKSSELALAYKPFRSYMWTRARYYVNAFFEVASSLSDPVLRATTGIKRFNRSGATGLLKSRLGQAIGMAMNGQTSLISLPDQSQRSNRIGFVGGGLTREIGEKFIEGVSVVDTEEDSNAQEKRLLNDLMMRLAQKSDKGD